MTHTAQWVERREGGFAWGNADWKSHRCGWHSLSLSLFVFFSVFLAAFVASPVAATVLRMPATIAGGSAPGKALKCFFMLCQLSQGNCLLPLGQLPAACCMPHVAMLRLAMLRFRFERLQEAARPQAEAAAGARARARAKSSQLRIRNFPLTKKESQFPSHPIPSRL